MFSLRNSAKASFRSVFCKHGNHQKFAIKFVSTNKLIDKVLIANRGEIACRIIRTAKKMGIKSVAVFSEADRDSMHTQLADEAMSIGPAPSSQSYLDMNKIISAAERSNSSAIHPGYGFLSENTEFAQLCVDKGITFVGPPATAIHSMGIKSTSKAIMSTAGVPVVPGYHGERQDDQLLLEEAKAIGFPVMIKAIRGGGGKGMRVALEESQFKEQLDSARRESMKAFGDDNMLIEKFIENPRHVEVQVFGDQHGNYVYLFERDCSVQRRHQKIIEEAPAPGISQATRERLGEAAVRAAKAVDYVGAGTVEFIYNPKDSQFYFMEMNTRLQVEHPVTEMITGTDLVEWQLRVAAGEELPLNQLQLKVNGHSFEARIYAEDPENNFMPGAGPLLHLRTPEPSADVRIETGVREGDEVSVHYDPMIAKLVVWGSKRDDALRRLRKSLAEYNIFGLKTNVDFLLNLSNHREFKKGNVYTNFIQDHHSELFPDSQPPDSIFCAAALAAVLKEKQMQKNGPSAIADRHSPFNLTDSKRMFGIPIEQTVRFGGKHKLEARLTLANDNEYSVRIGSKLYKSVGGHLNDQDCALTVCIDDVTTKYRTVFHDNCLVLFTSETSFVLELAVPNYLKSGRADDSGSDLRSVVAPMPGVVEKVLVVDGQSVRAGDSLVVMMAMKMEYVIKAHADAVVDKVLFKPGDSVPKGTQLIRFAT